ncbi:MAG: hypothetical protein J6A83_00560 [Clostridia bacterium]|nr:hypothetical protein [Clostridia bacterium]
MEAKLWKKEKLLVNNIKENKEKIFLFLFVVCMMSFSTGTYMTAYRVGATVSSVIILAMLCLYVLLFKKVSVSNIKINLSDIAFALVFTVCLLITKLVTDDSSNYYFLMIILLGVAFLIITFVEKISFMRAYIAAMEFFSIYSLICTYILKYTPIASWFPTFSHFSDEYVGGHITFRNFYFCNVYMPEYGDQIRNFGIFIEPGRFQFFILLALLFSVVVFKDDKKKLIRKFIILAAALISTFSTAGLVLGFLVFTLLLFSSAKLSFSNKAIFVGLSILFLAGLLSFANVAEELNASMDKLSGGGSLNARVGSIVGNIQAWFDKPIFGWGYSHLMVGEGSSYFKAYSEHNTCTTFTYFSCYGLVYGLLNFLGCLGFWINQKANGYSKFVFLTVFFLSLNNEYFCDALLIMIITFYGLRDIIQSREKETSSLDALAQ